MSRKRKPGDGKQGTPMTVAVITPARRRRRARARKREEARWAARSGPVTVRQLSPTEGEAP